jgi:hypothetical protein
MRVSCDVTCSDTVTKLAPVVASRLSELEMGEQQLKHIEMRMTVKMVRVMLAVWCHCRRITVVEAKGDS